MVSIERNKILWDKTYDWKNRGDEWSVEWGGPEQQWNWSILPRIRSFVPTGTILEIAPGYGRWTQFLKELCNELIVVDLSEKCVTNCRRRFGSSTHIRYHVNDGKSLSMIPDNSVDFVFSFDSLVHAEADVIESYINEISKKLKRDGVAFIHHSNLDGLLLDVEAGHMRAISVSASNFEKYVENADMRCISQEMLNWVGGEYLIDCISLFTGKQSKWLRPNQVIENNKFSCEVEYVLKLSKIYPASTGKELLSQQPGSWLKKQWRRARTWRRSEQIIMKGCNFIDDIKPEELSDEDWIKLAYLCLLQRRIDSVGHEYWLDKIDKGEFNYKDLIDSIVISPEYLMHYNVPFSAVLHKARQKWIKELEHFDRILDIGGSSGNTELGALIELGYPHRPKSIVVFDLPEEKQYWGKPNVGQSRLYEFSWGSIEYIHGYAEEIYTYETLHNRNFDCIFMGQTIEHIDPDSISTLLNWINNHLRPKGRFVFDTPNRNLTKIQSPSKWIDSDHKHEYAPQELEHLLIENGFEIVKSWGILNMPISYATNVFNPLEVYETEMLSDNVESSYCFAFMSEVPD
ncbi:methyltransferase domain-containing protein [Methanotrichaceae archaeon M04Ac]|uniref:Methyltransferase domain-containing protein n=1 Tax=Candidatus Methanocrinis alkalitolerans TaxID=3033395 RepID=A0ABT5XG94_9EURY|nr:methyltransferase domain-containing protein [Candidatus Methanocrinis alkalitolerans]MDF0593749.1 methyltransferase domain-containing protein [Candidatus Methanocrinis alkalitolerans]